MEAHASSLPNTNIHKDKQDSLFHRDTLEHDETVQHSSVQDMYTRL